jgi:hypothetical protein
LLRPLVVSAPDSHPDDVEQRIADPRRISDVAVRNECPLLLFERFLIVAQFAGKDRDIVARALRRSDPRCAARA